MSGAAGWHNRTTDMGNWSLGAACKDIWNPNIFMPDPETDSLEAQERKTAAAKKVCAGCPVILGCREYALESRESFGIWGGYTVAERVHVLRERRKHPGQEELAV